MTHLLRLGCDCLGNVRQLLAGWALIDRDITNKRVRPREMIIEVATKSLLARGPITRVTCSKLGRNDRVRPVTMEWRP